MNQEMIKENEAIARTNEKIAHKIVVMSGKGGVGKSTISTNIAYGLALNGYRVGILDADVHGPNIALMCGVEGKKAENLEPIEVQTNLKVVSLGMFLEKSGDPIVWRGPAKTKIIKQLIANVNWGELDFMVVDLPPGTGDEGLTIAQNLGNIDGAIIVTTPQDVALLDSGRSVKFAEMLKMPVLGIVENMSGFSCPHCGEKIDIFDNEKVSTYRNSSIELLGKIPLTPEIVKSGDTGKPFIYFNNGEKAAEQLHNIVNKVLDKVETKNMENEMEKESIKIALPTNDRANVEEHFGHCKEFAFYTVSEGNVQAIDYLTAPPHEPGVLPKFLGEKGANVIITGGMGARAIALFKDQNIEVILGATGALKDNLNEYLKGDLESKGSACSHNHEDHECSH